MPKLSIEKKETTKEKDVLDSPDKQNELEKIRLELKKTKDQNIILAKQIIDISNKQVQIANENMEMIKLSKRFNSFIDEMGKRFAEFSNFFENENRVVGSTQKIDYDKIAYLVNKYDLAKPSKKRVKK